MRTSTAANATPRSRKTSSVMCHSPSHFSAGCVSSSGSGNVGHGLEVLPVEIALAEAALEVDEFRQRDERARRVEVGADLEREHRLRLRPVAGGQLDDDRHVLALGGNMQEVHRAALGGQGQRLHDGAGAHAVQCGLFLVHDVADRGLQLLDVPVDVHHAGRALEDAAHLPGQREAPGLVGPVDFRDQRLEHGRPRRHLGDGDRGVVAGGDGRDLEADALGDGVALVGAPGLVHEVDLDIRDIRATAREVVAHQAVEIEGRGRAGIDLVVADLGLAADGGGHAHPACAALLTRALDDALRSCRCETSIPSIPHLSLL